jgi:hypothetical protein
MTYMFMITFLLVISHLQIVSKAIETQMLDNNADDVTPVRLRLQVSKRVLHAREPIRIFSYLENTSYDNAYYIGNNLGRFFVVESFHYIKLKIVDARKREVPIGRVAATSIWKEGTTIMEEYLLLRPGMTFGEKDEGNITLEPGHYELTTMYYEVEAGRWSDNERNSLRYPVWIKPLISNTEKITVLP